MMGAEDGDGPDEGAGAEREAACGVPVVEKRGAEAMKTDSCGGW